MDAPGVPIVMTDGVGPGGTATGRKAALLARAGARARLDPKTRLATRGEGWADGTRARLEAGMRGQASELAAPGGLDRRLLPGGVRAAATMWVGVANRARGDEEANGRAVDLPGLTAVGRGAWTATGRKALETGQALALDFPAAATG